MQHVPQVTDWSWSTVQLPKLSLVTVQSLGLAASCLLVSLGVGQMQTQILGQFVACIHEVSYGMNFKILERTSFKCFLWTPVLRSFNFETWEWILNLARTYV